MFKQNDFRELWSNATNGDIYKAPEILEEIGYTLKYRDKGTEDFYKPSLHIGQRKLLCNELQFLTNHLDNKDDDALVAYAGASPCMSLGVIAELFPNIKFILVDPNELYIKSIITGKSHYHSKNLVCYWKASNSNLYKNDKKKLIDMLNIERGNTSYSSIVLDKILDRSEISAINNTFDNDYQVSHLFEFIKSSPFTYHVIEDIFTNKLAENIIKPIMSRYKKYYKCNVFSWSDIRTNSNSSDDIYPLDIDIIWNLSQQYNWTKILNCASMLKFRCPFYNGDKKSILAIKTNTDITSDIELSKKNGIDFIEDYLKDILVYPNGAVMIQPWAGKTSTETRLVITSGKGELVQWDYKDYEDALFYYNSIGRPFCLHDNEFSNAKEGRDLCGDCSLEAIIIKSYLDKYEIDTEYSTQIYKYIDKVIVGRLIRDGHGKLFEPMTDSKYNILRALNLNHYQKSL